MRRQGELFHRIVHWDNLREAVGKALRGKRAARDARAFTSDLESNLTALRRGLLSGQIPLGRVNQFVIHDPKERRITAPCFEERVVHHAIMNVCEPTFESYLIGDSYACRRGKGREACLVQTERFARRHAWYLRMDVRKYFDSISHRRLFELLERRFKDVRLLELLERILASYCVSPGRGLPIGSLMSQHFANFYLGRADRFIKECLRATGYVRYMDDMAVWACRSQVLSAWRIEIGDFLRAELDLELKPNAYANWTRHGMEMLGCRVFPTHTELNARSRRRYRRRLHELERQFERSAISEPELQQRGQALTAFATSANVKSWSFRRRVIYQSGGDGQGHQPDAPRR